MQDIPNWILTIVQIVMTVTVGAVGFYIKRDAKRADKLIDEMAKFKLEISENYVRKDDYNRNQSEIIKRLDKLQEMLLKALTQR